jgi:hypothetical protein
MEEKKHVAIRDGRVVGAPLENVRMGLELMEKWKVDLKAYAMKVKKEKEDWTVNELNPERYRGRVGMGVGTVWLNKEEIEGSERRGWKKEEEKKRKEWKQVQLKWDQI